MKIEQLQRTVWIFGLYSSFWKTNKSQLECKNFLPKSIKVTLSQKTYLYYMNVCYWIYSSSIRPYSYTLSCEWEPKRDQIAIQRRVGIHEPTDRKNFSNSIIQFCLFDVIDSKWNYLLGEWDSYSWGTRYDCLMDEGPPWNDW